MIKEEKAGRYTDATTKEENACNTAFPKEKNILVPHPEDFKIVSE